MISLGYDCAIKITTDQPLPNSVLDDLYQAVNQTLAVHCAGINYDTAVDAPATGREQSG